MTAVRDMGILGVDAFEILCGDKIGSGAFRDVYHCRLNPDWVVKVEIQREGWRAFHNVNECRFWDDNQYGPAGKWLAPCHYLSPNGVILIQSRTMPVRKGELPDTLPAFLTDIKSENYGYFEGRVVCIDYASTISNYSMKMRKVKWRPHE